MNAYIGIDVGPTQMTTSVITSAGETLYTVVDKLGSQHDEQIFIDPREALRAINRQLNSLPKSSGIILRSIGISCSSELAMIWDTGTNAPMTLAYPYSLLSTENSKAHPFLKAQPEPQTPTSQASANNQAQDDLGKHLYDSMDSTKNIAIGPLESWIVQEISSSAVPIMDKSTAQRLFLQAKVEAMDQLFSSFAQAHFAIAPLLVNSIGKLAVVNHENLRSISGVPISALVHKTGAIISASGATTPGCAFVSTNPHWQLHFNLGTRPCKSLQMVQLAWTDSQSIPTYVKSVPASSAENTLSFIIKNLGLAKNPLELQYMAKQVRSSEQVMLVPYLKSSRQRLSEDNFMLSMSGIGISTTPNHLARSTFESLSIQIAEQIETLKVSCDVQPSRVMLTENFKDLDLLQQMISDYCQLPLQTTNSQISEATGAALLAAVGIGDLTLESLALGDGDGIIPSNNRRSVTNKTKRFVEVTRKLTSQRIGVEKSESNVTNSS